MIGEVEVVAKLGDSIIEIARVEQGGVYANPLVPFPLVCGDATGFVVHRPIGVSGWRCGVPLAGTSLRVAAGDSIVLELGRVTLYVLPITERAAAIPKRRFEQRPWIYGAVVLLVHLFVWGLAEATAPAPAVAIAKPLPQRRVRVTHVEVPPPPPPPRITTPTKIDVEPTSARPAKARSGRVRGGMRAPGEQAFLGAFGDVSMLIPSVDVVALVNESVAYDEGTAEEEKFGGKRRFDPFRDCTQNCGTIEAGPYQTISFRNRPKPPPRVEITGEDSVALAAIAKARAQFAACYLERALPNASGTVDVELEVARGGTLSVVYSRGVDTVGPCVGAVIQTMAIKGVRGPRTSIAVAFTPQ